MLDLAIRHKAELEKLFLNILDKPDYFFYSGQSWLKPATIEDSDWSYIERVSITSDKINGSFSADINRDSYVVENISLVSFDLTHTSFIFMKDLESFIDYLLYYKQFRKIKFWCYTKNPARRGYEFLIERFNGRKVGVYENDRRLSDGNFYSMNLYEISREAYLRNRRLK